MAPGHATADSVPELERFLHDTLERSQFNLSTVTLSGQSEWHLRGGTLSHRTGGFFHVAGLANRARSEEHLVLFQPQSALTGLALCRTAATVSLLLQARVEPGNSGVCQYGPTIQSTPANYLGLHAGRRTPCLSLFNTHQPGVRPLAASMQLDLGRRYFQKSKTHSYIELPALIETDPNMIWVQPLVESPGRGLVTLLCRGKGRETEFLVSVANEFGISGGSTIHPSSVVYPGEEPDRPTERPERGAVVAEFVQSDEGGRFHRHESTYQLVRVQGAWEPGDAQHWISAGALKGLLGTSNILSFQLRCIASLALALLNPPALGASPHVRMR